MAEAKKKMLGSSKQASDWHREVETGRRFEFGANWAAFLRGLTPERIGAAEQSLRTMLGAGRLDGKTFLDIGSGSGLFSLAARRLGASVTSFDFDPRSVACTAELKRRYFGHDPGWTVQEGSILDDRFLATLGSFDIVYSWGVLHHTGQMWGAIDNAARLVSPVGLLYLAIYNDQGMPSRFWTAVKRLYVAAPGPLKWAVIFPAFARLWGPTLLRDTLKGRPLETWRSYGEGVRGMDAWRDVVDWVGGYPFEVATPEQVIEFCTARGFELRAQNLNTGHGCSEFVFTSVP